MLRLLIGLVALVAAVWIASYATGRGVLVSSHQLMGSTFYGTTLPPGATDTPIGHTCTYLRHDFIRQQHLIDRDVWDGTNGATGAQMDARPIDSWIDTDCPLISEGLS